MPKVTWLWPVSASHIQHWSINHEADWCFIISISWHLSGVGLDPSFEGLLPVWGCVWTSALFLFIIINKRIVYKGLLHFGIFPSLNKGVQRRCWYGITHLFSSKKIRLWPDWLFISKTGNDKGEDWFLLYPKLVMTDP